MKLSHIGSVNTYVRCLKELHTWGYLEYVPSYNPQRGSRVNLYRFDTGSDKADDTGAVQVERPSINVLNNTETNTNREKGSAPTKQELIIFFKEKGYKILF